MKDINEFKSRIKKLYEYKIHDLNINKVESVYHMNEDETNQQQTTNQQVDQNQTQQPNQVAQRPEVQQPQQQVAQPKQDSNNDNQMLMSYLKSEMSKLDNVVDSIDQISKSVEFLSQRLENINKSVDEIKEPSDLEKLEMRAFDSYPYNKTLSKVWEDKAKSKEEQDAERMGMYKTDDGYEMEYIPNNNLNDFNSSTNSFTKNGY